jgi:hypothetical protein
MSNELFATKVVGHCIVKEHEYKIENGKTILLDEGKVVLDESNAVHPQNMARVFSRSLSNESNYFIHRVGFGNGGTIVDTASNILFNVPKDGLNSGDGHWEATMYNETYSEIIDDSNANIGSGTGTSPTNDPTSIEHVSGPGVRSSEDLTVGATLSSVTISVTLNINEPSGQLLTQTGSGNNIESSFSFDEIALFTSGSPSVSSSGFQNVNVGDKTTLSDTGLSTNNPYIFTMSIDGAAATLFSFTTPLTGTGVLPTAPTNSITYGDIIPLINAQINGAGATVSITEPSSVSGGAETFGFLKFESNTTGSSSSILITQSATANDIFSTTPILTGFASVDAAVNGVAGGVRNDAINPTTERERMLTHLTFSPVEKTQDRVLTITYTLNIVVARTT